MMVEVKLIQMSFSLILLLQITAVTGQTLYSTVRVGADITLPCKNLIPNQRECDSTYWTYYSSIYSRDFVIRGKIQKTEPHRLRVTANCSVVIKEVKEVDAGLYRCWQYKYGGTAKDTWIYLSVVNIKKEEDSERMRLSCSVLTYDRCPRSMTWLYGDKVMDKRDEDYVWTQNGYCFSSVTFKKPNNTELFKCAVQGGSTEVHVFPFSPGSSVDLFKTTGGDTTTATIPPMTSSSVTNRSGLDWWWYIVMAVVLAGILIIIVVLIIRWKKNKGNKTQKNGYVQPEDGVCYASVNYIKNPRANTQVQVKDDEEDTVTYSVVIASSSSSAAASTDPSHIYATIDT